MRIGVVAESLLDCLALLSGRVPVPIIEAFPSIVLARCIMAGVRLGIFDALESGDLSAEGVARLCGTEPHATGKLLAALAGARYLRHERGRYGLTSQARRWLTSTSPQSVRDYLCFHYAQWEWLGRTEDFVRTGEPLRFHAAMTPDEWEAYQRGMRVIARLTAPEVARRIPVPRHARALLDIGGAHGYYAVTLCRRHPHLRAVVLDLPQAVVHAAPLLAEACMGDRVTHQAGDALATDFGEARYDVVFMANLAHHFTPEQNAALLAKIARALRRGGICVVQEGIRPTGERHRFFESLGDFYFALTSEAGLYSFAEIAGWQRAAGLHPQRPIRLLTAPGQGLQIARRP